MSKKGWVIIDRQIQEGALWFADPFSRSHAWIDLIINANHSPKSIWIKGVEIKLKRGQIGWSEITMSKRWKWSRNKVRRFLFYLENERQIKQQKIARLTTVITISNYEKFQKDNRRNENRQEFVTKTIQRTEQQKKPVKSINKNISDNNNLRTEQQTIQQKDNRRYNGRNTTKQCINNEKNIIINNTQNFEKQIAEIIFLFKNINPIYKQWYNRKTVRDKCRSLLENFGFDKVKNAIQFIEATISDKYAPTITTPAELEVKWGKLQAYYIKSLNEKSKKLRKA